MSGNGARETRVYSNPALTALRPVFYSELHHCSVLLLLKTSGKEKALRLRVKPNTRDQRKS